MSNAMGRRIPIADAVGMDADALRARIVENGVSVIEGGDVDVAAFAGLVERLGEYAPHPLRRFRAPEDPRMLIVSNLVRDGEPVGILDGGAYWHTDMSYKTENQIFTALYCKNPPAHGGSTMFIDCRAGWATIKEAVDSGRLPLGIDADGLRSATALHRFGNRARDRNPGEAVQTLTAAETAALDPGVMHPLIQTHPLSGAEYIYAVAGTSCGLSGYAPAAAVAILDGLLDYLLAHASVYVHEYQRGDIVIWDNLTTLHRGPEIEPTEDASAARILYRMSLNYSHAQ